MIIKVELIYSIQTILVTRSLGYSPFIYIQFHRNLTQDQIITVILTQFQQTFINMKKN